MYPRLLAEQFDEKNLASITVPFAGKTVTVVYENPGRKDFGEYIIGAAVFGGDRSDSGNEKRLAVNEDAFVVIARKTLAGLSGKEQTIYVRLD